VLNAITETIISHFKAIEEGDLDVIDLSNNFLLNTSVDKLKQGIIAEIPIGVVTGNTLLANLGPKLPVKLSIAGEIESEIGTNVDYYGINSALITVYVNIDVSQQIYMPIATDRVVVSQKIPIAIKMIQGVVPNCYFGSLTSSVVSRPIKWYNQYWGMSMKIVLNNNEYELVKEYKDAFNLDDLTSLATDYFVDFDYILGDYAYNKLRLKGFCDKNNKKCNKINDIKTKDDYLKNQCAYECNYFLIKKVK